MEVRRPPCIGDDPHRPADPEDMMTGTPGHDRSAAPSGDSRTTATGRKRRHTSRGGHVPVLLLALLAMLTGITGCATRPVPEEPPVRSDDPAAAFPAQVQLPGQKPVTLPEQPKRIVSLSPTATETLYAIGAGKQVVAVDRYSDYPKQAPQTKMSGLTASASSVAGYDPDLVIAPSSAAQLAKGLREIDIPVLLTPSAADLEAAYRQIKTLGKATGHADKARELVNRMSSEIAEIVASTPEPERTLTYYHEVSPDFYTTTSRSFVGNIYAKFGLKNIADKAGGKFPQLSEEHILQANPDMIFLADVEAAGVTAKSVAARPGWGTLTAVQKGHVFELDDDIASRWGPRIVEFARTISDAVTRVQRS